MKRMNLRDVPDDVYTRLAEAAEANRQSLNAFVIDRLVDVVRVSHLAEYVDAYVPPAGTGVTVADVVEAVHEGRAAS